MKALFITTFTNDVANHIAAWNSIADVPAEVEVFDYQGVQNCWRFGVAAKAAKPDVIFYIGSCEGTGNPKPSSLRALRDIAPTINIVSDACDRVWHPVMREYARNGCFDAQVAIDGPSDAPADVHGVTPVALAWFDPPIEKDIAFGFSGNCGVGDPRSKAIVPLTEAGLLEFRMRAGTTSPFDSQEAAAIWRETVWLSGYLEHINVLRRSKATINTSFTGSAERNHVKGRVVEAGMAGCALFEDDDSPAHGIVPEGAIIPYDLADPLKTVRATSMAQIEDSAALLSEHARKHWRPEQVYGAMLDAAKVAYPGTFPAR